MLQKALAGIEVFENPDVLVGYQTADDAGVYRLNPSTALVHSVDFFTPVVDDPFTYGRIAAANALSDIYAMGATPVVALSIVGFPAGQLEEHVLHEILRGGAHKMREARVAIIGGHSVRDPELKFGYAVTGLAHPDRIYTNARARPGDLLLLSKPLGTGIITTGIRSNQASLAAAQAAISWMLRLNEEVARHLSAVAVGAVTDITGYGLLGHAYEMAAASQVTLHLDVTRIPLIEGAYGLAKRGVFPGGTEANRRYVADAVAWNETTPLQQKILLDPETSGGLLISLPAPDAEALTRRLAAEATVLHCVGHVSARGDYLLQVHSLGADLQ